MTERERWVVYPLLFLALGAALRDKLIDRTVAKSIKCQELLVIDEQPFGREMLLARIGPGERSDANGQGGGHFLLNGQLEVIDRDAHRLVAIGEAPASSAALPGGYVAVNGQVVVNGPINAKYYAYQGTPLLPAVFPGVSLPALLRALPQLAEPQQQGNVPRKSPGMDAPMEPSAPSQPAEESREPAETPPPVEPSSPAEPLADPAENR